MFVVVDVQCTQTFIDISRVLGHKVETPGQRRQPAGRLNDWSVVVSVVSGEQCRSAAGGGAE